jgi:hypothetical protein
MTTTTIIIASFTCAITFFYLSWKNEHNRKKEKKDEDN